MIDPFNPQENASSLQRLLYRWHIDLPLLVGLSMLMLAGLFILYSATSQTWAPVSKQMLRLGAGLMALFVLAQISPQTLQRWSLRLYVLGVLLLAAVLLFGDIGKGAQRWLDLGLFRFQPSELMKIFVPMMIAATLADQPLPPRLRRILMCLVLILGPAYLVAKQPDLGTALLITSAGLFVLYLAGMSWKIIAGSLSVIALAIIPAWKFLLHEYQKQRVLTFLNPESDPLGAGYHTIQSKIAVGSGGTYGKGWLNGTQSQLDFLPERTTDFIFAVFSEEFGLIGALLLLTLYLFLIIRGLVISWQAQDTYSRLLAGSLSLTFFIYVFVNTGMVIGLLPVVGVPLPLVSYGGTSAVTLLAGFGILMSIQTHRKLLSP